MCIRDSHHGGPLRVLEGTGDDLRGTRRLAVGEDDHRDVGGETTWLDGYVGLFPRLVHGLVDDAVGQELAGNANGLVHVAAGVEPQVEDDGGRAGRLRLGDRVLDALRGPGRELLEAD